MQNLSQAGNELACPRSQLFFMPGSQRVTDLPPGLTAFP